MPKAAGDSATTAGARTRTAGRPSLLRAVGSVAEARPLAACTLSNVEQVTRGSELPPDTRSLLELLAERLDLAVGVCRLEVELADGVVRSIWRHEKTPGTALGRFDERR